MLNPVADIPQDIAEPQLAECEWDANDYSTLELLMVKDGAKPK